MLIENIRINRVGDVRSGKSTATGKEWESLDVTLGFEDGTGNSYIFATVAPEVWNSLGYKEGDVATLNLRFRTRTLSSGFVVNDIRIIKSEK